MFLSVLDAVKSDDRELFFKDLKNDPELFLSDYSVLLEPPLWMTSPV